jgi:hypothetical protein
LIISIDAEKAFDKIQHHFMIKALRKLGVDRMYFNIYKGCTNKPIGNIILNGEKTETISPKLRNETRIPTFSTPIKHSLGIPSQSNKARRRNKRIQISKEIVKISLFAEYMILYLKDQ